MERLSNTNCEGVPEPEPHFELPNAPRGTAQDQHEDTPWVRADVSATSSRVIEQDLDSNGAVDLITFYADGSRDVVYRAWREVPVKSDDDCDRTPKTTRELVIVGQRHIKPGERN